LIVPTSISQNLEKYADEHNLSRTDVLISALNLLTTPELNETLKYKAEAAKKQKKVKDLKSRLAPFLNKKDEMDQYQLAKFKFQVMKDVRTFDKMLLEKHETAERWSNVFHSHLLRGEGKLPTDVISALKLRLEFLYSSVFPDLFIYYEEEITSDGEKQTIRNTKPLWYTFAQWFENGCKKPERPIALSINPLRRQDYITGAKQSGKKHLIIPQTTMVLSHEKQEPPPRLVHDAPFDELMDDAEELEKSLKKPKPEASP
jgi:hypothetical protein